MITSSRKFGIEIEFVLPNRTAFDRLSKLVPLVRDGSLRPLEFAFEYVSPILDGPKGEVAFRRHCDYLKVHGADASNPKTSVHVHLDGRTQDGVQLRSSRTRPKDGVFVGVSNKLKPEINLRSLTSRLLSYRLGSRIGVDSLNGYNEGIFDGVLYLSKGELSKAPRLGYTYYWVDRNDRFKWLRNVMYFYTQYSQVMQDIVSNSRRINNMYCIPLDMSYDLSAIESVTNMDELRHLWYKGRGSSGHYDDSRYHNVNLHCYWDRHGTVEIRSHGGTIDPDKILLWVKLHQKIVDKLEDIELNEFKVTDNLHKAFIDFIEEPILQEYVRRLLGYYSGITVK